MNGTPGMHWNGAADHRFQQLDPVGDQYTLAERCDWHHHHCRYGGNCYSKPAQCKKIGC